MPPPGYACAMDEPMMSPDAIAAPMLPARALRAGAGADWIVDAWRLFRRAKLMWILFVVLFFLLSLAISLLPVVGSLVGSLLSPVILGGILSGARSLDQGGEMELEHFLGGFRERTASLLGVGALYLAGQLALMALFAGFVGLPVFSAMLSGDLDALSGLDVEETAWRAVLGALVTLLLAAPLFAAFWFAPALVALGGMAAVPAMKASFTACLRNWLPMLDYGILATVLLLAALIPLLLGLIVWVPVMLATLYTSYQSVFTEPAAA